MKILYAIEDRCGAAIQLKQFIDNTSHQIRIAAYPSASTYVNPIDWNLYAIRNDATALSELNKDVKNYYPDLVIVDGESIISKIASYLEIPIVYCSPLHLLDGIVWKKGQRQYSAHLEQVRQRLKKFPQGVCKFIYSPFGDLDNSPELRDGFEWIQPYHKTVPKHTNSILLSTIEDNIRDSKFQTILQKLMYSVIFDKCFNNSYIENLAQSLYIFTEGHTQYISDALYNNRYPIIVPNTKDPETLLNAIWCCNLTVGVDVGQAELIGRAALSQIDKALDGISIPICHQIVPQHKKLNERINELWECM